MNIRLNKSGKLYSLFKLNLIKIILQNPKANAIQPNIIHIPPYGGVFFEKVISSKFIYQYMINGRRWGIGKFLMYN